jgi:uncharacterized membrane protein
MNSDQAWKIIDSNLPKFVGLMVTVAKGSWVDVFCDQSGKNLSFSKPSAVATIKLCSVTAPDLVGSYGIHQEGNYFVDDEGGRIPNDQLAAHLTEYITNMKSEGNEWGWEFKV